MEPLISFDYIDEKRIVSIQEREKNDVDLHQSIHHSYPLMKFIKIIWKYVVVRLFAVLLISLSKHSKNSLNIQNQFFTKTDARISKNDDSLNLTSFNTYCNTHTTTNT
jgi:hypothetical protein